MRDISPIDTAPQARFADMAARYGPALHRFCRSLTYSKEDADDLFQETFLNVLEGRRAVRPEQDPQSALFSAALSLWKSRKRKFARRSRIAPVAPLDETAPSGADTEAELLAREETRAVRALVEALPEKLRLPILLHYAAELKLPEIAAALAIPEGTVKSRLFQARKQIEKGWIAREQSARHP